MRGLERRRQMTALALTSDGYYLMHGKKYSPATIVKCLEPLLTDTRREKLNYVLNHRSNHCLPVMEHIHDVGNINAVMRSAEILGFSKLANIPSQKFKKSSRVTSGADKWVRIDTYQNQKECYDDLRAKGYTICATALRSDAISFTQLDLSKPRAFVFGNEKKGVTQETLDLVDECTIIPTVGFTESFNISVAAAIVMSKIRDFVNAHDRKYLLSEDEIIKIKARQLLLQFKYQTVIKHINEEQTV